MGNKSNKAKILMEAEGYKGCKSFLNGPVGDGFVPGNPDFVRFVFISDTHTYHKSMKLPKGDVLIHTGDFTMSGDIAEIKSFSDWLGTQDFKHKIVISGNHEVTFDLEREKSIRYTFALE